MSLIIRDGFGWFASDSAILPGNGNLPGVPADDAVGCPAEPFRPEIRAALDVLDEASCEAFVESLR